ncbi:MAG: Mob1/phocein family protein [Puniceicoccales bacterium]|jgi:hypothetical protein|nr:Mob1/phocein family protein [Puniceicoccales bacterium]
MNANLATVDLFNLTGMVYDTGNFCRCAKAYLVEAANIGCAGIRAGTNGLHLLKDFREKFQKALCNRSAEQSVEAVYGKISTADNMRLDLKLFVKLMAEFFLNSMIVVTDSSDKEMAKSVLKCDGTEIKRINFLVEFEKRTHVLRDIMVFLRVYFPEGHVKLASTYGKYFTLLGINPVAFLGSGDAPKLISISITSFVDRIRRNMNHVRYLNGAVKIESCFEQLLEHMKLKPLTMSEIRLMRKPWNELEMAVNPNEWYLYEKYKIEKMRRLTGLVIDMAAMMEGVCDCEIMKITDDYQFMCSSHTLLKGCEAIVHSFHTIGTLASLLRNEDFYDDPFKNNDKIGIERGMKAVCQMVRRFVRIFLHAAVHHMERFLELEKVENALRSLVVFAAANLKVELATEMANILNKVNIPEISNIFSEAEKAATIEKNSKFKNWNMEKVIAPTLPLVEEDHPDMEFAILYRSLVNKFRLENQEVCELFEATVGPVLGEAMSALESSSSSSSSSSSYSSYPTPVQPCDPALLLAIAENHNLFLQFFSEFMSKIPHMPMDAFESFKEIAANTARRLGTPFLESYFNALKPADVAHAGVPGVDHTLAVDFSKISVLPKIRGQVLQNVATLGGPTPMQQSQEDGIFPGDKIGDGRKELRRIDKIVRDQRTLGADKNVMELPHPSKVSSDATPIGNLSPVETDGHGQHLRTIGGAQRYDSALMEALERDGSTLPKDHGVGVHVYFFDELVLRILSEPNKAFESFRNIAADTARSFGNLKLESYFNDLRPGIPEPIGTNEKI